MRSGFGIFLLSDCLVSNRRIGWGAAWGENHCGGSGWGYLRRTHKGGAKAGRSSDIDDVWLSFGGVNALSGVSLDVRKNEILAIIGPNGAGKTALLNCISGFYKPQKGEIYFGDKKITRQRPDKLAKMGIARTFQNIELYTGLSTQDNIMAARHVFMKQNFVTGAIYFGWSRREEIKHRQIVEEIIDFLEIQSIRKQPVGALPYGLRKRVEIGRALALEPKVLLLDEPMAGMNLEEKEDIARFIIDVYEGQGDTYPDNPVLRDGIRSIIMVEHDMGVVMDLADRVAVLDFGRKIGRRHAGGDPAQPRRSSRPIWAKGSRTEMLSVNNIEVAYLGVIHVLHGISLEVGDGKIVALIGANGGGKTTTLKAISGLLKTEQGEHHRAATSLSTTSASTSTAPKISPGWASAR